MRRPAITRPRLLVAAALFLMLLVLPVAIAGTATDSAGPPTATGAKAGGGKGTKKLNKKVKKLNKKVKKLKKRVKALEAPSSAETRRANYAAAAFTAVEESTHNSMGDSVCGSFVASEQGSENQGDLNAKLGSFLMSIEPPDGVKIERLAMFANDFSAEDAHVYLVRKQIANALDPQFEGYLVLANAKTSGAVDAVMREFSATVSHGDVDTQRYYYFLELVVCDFIEPFAIQVQYT